MNKTLTLNVGMDTESTEALSANVIRESLAATGLLLGRQSVVQSDTEKTLVVEVTPGPDITSPARMRGAIFQSAVDLRQDCIAAWNERTNTGGLIGPRAAAWGRFNPEFFFNLEGRRMAQKESA